LCLAQILKIENENVGFFHLIVKINNSKNHSQLPLENWSDLLPFVPRLQLVPLLFQVGDRQFASILQYCLNEVGQITLGHLRIRPPKENGPIDGPIVELLQMPGLDLIPVLKSPMPDEPIPKNVHNFHSLTFRFLDII
jgi:hypothetical protein